MDEDVVPGAARVEGHEGEPYHSGRGGEGNAHLPDGAEKGKPVGLAERLKKKIFGWMK